jgi:hypothetical protein
MWETVYSTYDSYMSFYRSFLLDQWAHMTPLKYGVMLLSIGFFGWIMMKSGAKQT